MPILEIKTTRGVENEMNASERETISRELATELSKIPELQIEPAQVTIDWSGLGKLSKPFSDKELIVVTVEGLFERENRSSLTKKALGARITNVLSDFLQRRMSSYPRVSIEVWCNKSVEIQNDGYVSFDLLPGPDPDAHD